MRTTPFIAIPISRLKMTAILWVAAIATLACANIPFLSEAIDCHPLKELPENTEGLISRDEAERMAREFPWQGPATNWVEIEDVRVSCLGTYGSYEKDVNSTGGRVNPELRPPEMPVWVVEFNSLSWDANEEWDSYVMVVLRAVDGEPLTAVFGPESTLGR